MAEKSLFYNALPDSGYTTGYDRNYNADDISDWLATVLTTGVIKTNTALKVTAAGGMSVSVALGKAVINGKPYINDAAKSFTVPTAPTGSTNRIDLVVLRFDKAVSTRDTHLVYITGSVNNTIPAIKRDVSTYDIVLAKITVAPNVTSITNSNIVDLRGDTESSVTTESGTSLGFCPWLVAAKGYDNYYDAIVLEYEDTVTMANEGTTVLFNIPTYGFTGIDILNVYVNGMREPSANYTITNRTLITFTSAKLAGTKVQVVVEKFIDGDGLGTALAGYQQLQTIVASLQNVDAYNYVCNGATDNVALSNIAQAWLTGGTDNGSKIIRVFGTFGATAPVGGSGTSSSGYRWFNFGLAGTSHNRKIVFDFTGCGQINLPLATYSGGKNNIVFYGDNVNIIGANVVASDTTANSVVRVFSSASGAVYAENCRFWVTSSLGSYISQTGTFKNCRGSVTCNNANAVCFQVNGSSLLRVEGGEYYAYTTSSYASYVVAGSTSTGVAILYAVNMPTVARTGYLQSAAVNISAGHTSLTDTMTTLTIAAAGANIRGTLAISKAGQM